MAYTTIDKPDDYFNTVLYTGRWCYSIEILQELDFQPDLVWIKERSGSGNHNLSDVVRGATKELFSNNKVVQNNRTGNGWTI
jgi:hypothetical protein